MPAQDRARRGPFGALLILLSLFLGSVTAGAAGTELREAAHLGSSRQRAAAALLLSGPRNGEDDALPRAGSGSALPPSATGIVTQLLWTAPLAAAASRAGAIVPRRANAAYRARAPPAS